MSIQPDLFSLPGAPPAWFPIPATDYESAGYSFGRTGYLVRRARSHGLGWYVCVPNRYSPPWRMERFEGSDPVDSAEHGRFWPDARSAMLDAEALADGRKVLLYRGSIRVVFDGEV